MKKVEFITHKNLSEEILTSICLLKKKAWDYPIEEHRRWIKENINLEDIHVLLTMDNTYVAYLNLISLKIDVKSGQRIDALGIGNVCTTVKNQGYGSELLVKLNEKLEKEKIHAILFCRKPLINFYSRHNYRIVEVFNDGIYLMSLNCDFKFSYSGKLF